MFYSRSSVCNPIRPNSGITQHMHPPGTRVWNITLVLTNNGTQFHTSCFYTLGDQVAATNGIPATMALHLVVAARNDVGAPNFLNFALGEGNRENHVLFCDGMFCC